MSYALYPASHFPALNPAPPAATWNVAGSRVAKARHTTVRNASHPSRAVAKEADSLSDLEEMSSDALLAIRNYGEDFLMPVGRLTTRMDDGEVSPFSKRSCGLTDVS